MRNFATMVLLVIAGFACGWIARDLYLQRQVPADRGASPFVPAAAHVPSLEELVSRPDFATLAVRLDGDLGRLVRLMQDQPVERRIEALRAFVAANGETFATLSYAADLAASQQAFDRAVELLLDAALQVTGADQKDRLEHSLSAVTEAYSKQLLARQQFDELDHLYERITFALPELPDYFLKLGLLRIRLGNFDAALPPLSQIQNHGALGEQARTLMEQAAASEALTSPTIEQLPLRAAGSQFVVDAVIDDDSPVALLVDTGAAMTVIDASVLERLGYSLDSRREYFATAGGVVEAPVVSLQRLSLGGAAINQLAVGALALDMPEGINGLLGMNFLRHFDFRIDQESRVLHLDVQQ